MRTSAFAAQKALYDALVASEDFEGIPIYFGAVTGQVPEEFIYVAGEVDSGRQDYELSALSAKSEQYELRVEVFTQYATDDYTLVQQRLETVTTPLERLIHDDSTLGGTVMMANVSRFRMEEAVFEGQRQGLFTIWVACEAWLGQA